MLPNAGLRKAKNCTVVGRVDLLQGMGRGWATRIFRGPEDVKLTADDFGIVDAARRIAGKLPRVLQR